jgi:hypothetical protein
VLAGARERARVVQRQGAFVGTALDRGGQHG